MDVTFPLVPLTGHERSLEKLTSPDPRILGYTQLTVERLQAPYLTLMARLPATTPPELLGRIKTTRDLAVYGYFVYEFHTISMLWAIVGVEMALKMKFVERYPDPISVTRKAKDATEESCQITVAELQDYRRQKWRVPGMKDFDYSLRALLAWAFREKLLPFDIPIPVPEIVNTFYNRFMLETFPKLAVKERLLKSEPKSWGEIVDCWNGLSDAKKNHYLPNSKVLIEGLPHFRNMMAHPRHYNMMLFPRAPIGTYELLIDVVARLWAAPA